MYEKGIGFFSASIYPPASVLKGTENALFKIERNIAGNKFFFCYHGKIIFTVTGTKKLKKSVFKWLFRGRKFIKKFV